MLIKSYLVRLAGRLATRLVIGCVASDPGVLRNEIEALLKGLQRLDRCCAFGVGNYAKTLIVEAHGPHAVLLAAAAMREVGGDRTVLVYDAPVESYLVVARNRDADLRLGTAVRDVDLVIESEFDSASATYVTCDDACRAA